MMRPTNWFPLTGGDPCPGNPDAYASVISYWEAKAVNTQEQAAKLAAITNVNGESNRIRRVEQVAAEGQMVLENMAGSFAAVKSLLKDWRLSLAELQARADEALKTAQAAHSTIEEHNSYIGTLGLFAADLKQEMREQCEAKKSALQEEISVCQGSISLAQRTVDEVREEYSRKSAEVVSAYALNVEGFWSAQSATSPVGSFGASSDAVSDILRGDLSAGEILRLKQLASAAGNGPAEYEAYLNALAKLDAGALAEFFGESPDLARYPLPAPGDAVWEATTVKAWWAKLGADQQAALIHHASGMTGNLNGTPYGIRDQANRALLDEMLADEATAQSTKDTLLKLRVAAQYTVGKDDPKSLIALDLSNLLEDDGNTYNDVLAAVAMGSVDAAEKTTVLVPGMDNNVDGSIGSLVQTAQAVYKEQRIPGNNKHATIAWIGYESPQLSKTVEFFSGGTSKSVLQPDLAQAGGEKLARFYDGLNVTKSANAEVPVFGAGQTDAYNDPFVSLTSHSYGTTTSGYALSSSQTKVDNTIFYDSAGLTFESIAMAQAGAWQVESQGDKQNIFYTEVASDQSLVARTGSLFGGRKLPRSPRIPGAVEFSSEGGFDASGNYLEDADEHGLFKANDKMGPEDYRFSSLYDGNADGILSPGTSSLYYSARISLGYYEVTEQRLISPEHPNHYSYPSYPNYHQHYPRGPYSISHPYQFVQDGKLSAEKVQRFAKEQGIDLSDLTDTEGD